MKRFLLSVACFMTIVSIFDFLYGACCKYMNNHPKRGETYYRNYLINKSVDDIVMFGSSRMVHHYVSNIFSESFGMTVWNAGVDGMGIIMNYGYLELLLRHHTPQVIIYDISPYDIYIDDNVKQLKNLKPYVGIQQIKEIIKAVEPHELIKLQSHLYMYNSSLLPLARDFIKSGGKGDYNGYSPLSGVMEEAVCDIENSTFTELKIDDVKIGLLKKFVSLCKAKGIRLIMLVSPEFCCKPTVLSTSIESIVNDLGTFINYSFIDGISNDFHMFQDREHLNNNGSILYTKALSESLKTIINK